MANHDAVIPLAQHRINDRRRASKPRFIGTQVFRFDLHLQLIPGIHRHRVDILPNIEDHEGRIRGRPLPFNVGVPSKI